MRVSHFKFGVTFNGCRGAFEVGDSDEGTTDYISDDVVDLIKEVVVDSITEDYQLTYFPVDDGDEVVGIFCDKWAIEAALTGELPIPTAILYREQRTRG